MSAEVRRAQLLQAAVRVMTRDGLAAGTTRAIVAEAGMSLATFHYCFHSRTELLRELITLPTDPAGTPSTGDFPATGGFRETDGFRESLRREIFTPLQLLTSDPGQRLFQFELTHHALRSPELHDLAVQQYQQRYLSVQQLLTGAAERARMTWQLELATLARLVVIMLDGAQTTWLADRNTERTSAALETLLDHLCALAVPSTRSR